MTVASKKVPKYKRVIRKVVRKSKSFDIAKLFEKHDWDDMEQTLDDLASLQKWLDRGTALGILSEDVYWKEDLENVLKIVKELTDEGLRRESSKI